MNTAPAPRSRRRPPTLPFAALLLAAFGIAVASASAANPAYPRQLISLHRDWSFHLGATPQAESPAFDDTTWEHVRVPHDWAIGGPYEPEGDPHTGKLPWRNEAWYRRPLVLPPQPPGTRAWLQFDGVMANPTVYVNGRVAGTWDYGYTSFQFDITPFLHPDGGTNVLAVHVDTRNHQSRWYPGAGIYRAVRLVLVAPVHVAPGGLAITTPRADSRSAHVEISTTVENQSDQAQSISLITTLLDPRGRVVANQRTDTTLAAGASLPIPQSFDLAQPALWDIAGPRLHTAECQILVAGRVLDAVRTPFGIRTFEFTADDGFHLNGRRVQLYGINLHHDQGPLGSAFNVRAMERQLEIMRDMGANALRTSHNPPAPEVLDLCDRLGFVVWDEAFDKWDATSTRPAHVSMAEHGHKHIQSLVRRDRNHPSVVVWSVGNEIWDLEGLKIPDSPGLLRQMVGFVKELDTSRPVTLAHCVPPSANSPLDDSLDVGGWNYARRYALSRRNRPQLPIIYSESASAYSTRGHYELPHPARKDDYSTALLVDSYDLNCASYSDLVDVEFALMEQDRFVAGEFVWTGFDYLGEPVPYVANGWGGFTKRALKKSEETRVSSFGIVDLVGLPKDRFYLYRSHWAPEKPTVHLLPHWNWPERVGTNVPVYVYTSGDSAELFLDGRSLGRRTKQPAATNVLDRYRLRWEDAPYRPGKLEAVAYRDGRRIGKASVRTAANPAALRLVADRRRLAADGDDLAYVRLEAVDDDGNPCPLAMNPVDLIVSGPARLAGVGNGDPHFPAEFDVPRVNLFYGQAVAIVRTDEDHAGRIRVTASAPGLRSATVSLQSVPPNARPLEPRP